MCAGKGEHQRKKTEDMVGVSRLSKVIQVVSGENRVDPSLMNGKTCPFTLRLLSLTKCKGVSRTLGVAVPVFRFCLCHSLAVWSWDSHSLDFWKPQSPYP